MKLIHDVHISLYFLNLVKVNDVWVKTKSKQTKIWNGESRKHAYDKRLQD